LYGFPIQQAIVGAHNNHPLALDVMYVLPLTFSVAALSWWIVERPTLGLRRYLPVIENIIMGRVMKLLPAVEKIQTQ
jgi:peptidoglycan/LPS O-acetylase OafA/YrhL